jgi:predicted MFS family arabinose efflux permease
MVLFVVALLNYVDRSVLAILQVPVKRDLALSDTEMGALTGLAFALLYTTLALPIARIADKSVRTRLLAGALLVWSAMTAASGFARTFAMLVICRMGVALGEAGCVPATHSLISDYFQRHQRATALALWGLSLPCGTMLGLAAGGWLNDAIGWRNSFIGIGIAGVALAPIVLVLLREPKRGRFDPKPAGPPPTFSQRQALGLLWRTKAFRYAALAGALHAYTQHTMLNWNGPFYIRVYHMPVAEAANYLALIFGIGGGLGTFLGGFLTDRIGKADARWYLRLPALASLLIVPLGLGQYLAPTPEASLGFGFAVILLVHVYLAPIVATAQTLVPAEMRAFTSAVLVLTVNLLGMGLGPMMTGAISDVLSGHYGVESGQALRYAIGASLAPCLAASWLFWVASGHLAGAPKRGAEAPIAAAQRH